MQTVYVAGGNVGMSQLISGEIQDLAGVAVMSTTSAATEYQRVKPTGTAATDGIITWVTSETSLGVSGQAGDYLAALEINNYTALNASVFLEDGNEDAPLFGVGYASGVVGSTPSGGATVQLTMTSNRGNLTIATNQLVGYVIGFLYTPAGAGAVPITMLRRVVANVATANTTLIVDVSHLVANGAGAISTWELKPLTCYEVQPFNTPVGARHIPMDRVSTYGAWKLSVDGAVQVVASGIFSG